MSARILIIEDNLTNMELMIYLLNAFGYSTLTASDGEAGLERARREHPDLIICDIQIPKMNGYEVAHQLKSHPVLRHIPLVAVTAYAMVDDRDKALAAGFDGYMTKPIDPETFIQQVEKFLPHNPGSNPGHAAATIQQTSNPLTGNSATILAVDNSLVNLELLRSTLEPFGYHVITAGGTKQAMALLQNTRPDLIISDVHIPGESGYDFIRVVKADPRLRQIPFVFLSSTVWRDHDPEVGLSLGADRFLLRPMEPEALLAEIEACLHERNA